MKHILNHPVNCKFNHKINKRTLKVHLMIHLQQGNLKEHLSSDKKQLLLDFINKLNTLK